MTLVADVRAALAAAGDPERAAGQRAYMKSALPYYGVTLPQLRREADPWLRRAAVICQVGHRAATDPGLLREAVLANVEDTSFWLLKHLG